MLHTDERHYCLASTQPSWCHHRAPSGVGGGRKRAHATAPDTFGPPVVEMNPELIGRGPKHARDAQAQDEEREGVMQFQTCRNDGNPRHLIWLTALRRIFCMQLPKMPKEYITRLVMAPNHHSIMLFKRDTVIGGICFLPFFEQQFAEIVFCAIDSTEQVRGYGTHLMNHLKEYVKTCKLYHFLTYADNTATGYFKKQGFSADITLPPAQWRGFIKDYDDGTLMHCHIHTGVNYLTISSELLVQRQSIFGRLRAVSNSHVVHTGLRAFRAHKHDFALDGIPGLDQANMPAPELGVDTPIPAYLTEQLRRLFDALWKHEASWPFREAVDTAEVNDYLDVVADPIDLSIIQARLDGGAFYRTSAIFLADARRIVSNCKAYNLPDSRYAESADRLSQFLETQVKKQGLV